MTQRRIRLLAGAIVALPLLTYPVVVLASGGARFPTRHECIRSVVENEPVKVVFGRFASPEEAAALRDRVVSVGFIGTEALLDGCGRWVVELANVPDEGIGSEVVNEAKRVGLDPTLEYDPDS